MDEVSARLNLRSGGGLRMLAWNHVPRSSSRRIWAKPEVHGVSAGGWLQSWAEHLVRRGSDGGAMDQDLSWVGCSAQVVEADPQGAGPGPRLKSGGGLPVAGCAQAYPVSGSLSRSVRQI